MRSPRPSTRSIWATWTDILANGLSFAVYLTVLTGLHPLPLAVVVVGVLEGAAGGAGFGVGVGALCSAVYTGSDGLILLGLCLIGLGCGALSQYVLRRDLLGCFLCALLGLCLLDFCRIALRMAGGERDWMAMFSLAGREILWSLVFVAPVYALFHWVFQRVPKKTHF